MNTTKQCEFCEEPIKGEHFEWSHETVPNNILICMNCYNAAPLEPHGSFGKNIEIRGSGIIVKQP